MFRQKAHIILYVRVAVNPNDSKAWSCHEKELTYRQCWRPRWAGGGDALRTDQNVHPTSLDEYRGTQVSPQTVDTRPEIRYCTPDQSRCAYTLLFEVW